MSVILTEHTLPNGLRVVCETLPNTRSTSLGFLVRTGARHEAPDQHGVSHFLEHMCFKGTAKRNGIEINVRFDELGSMYNAFTGKEHTVYYGWVPSDRMEPQLELLADMMRPTLPHEDYETERKVILEEIAMNDDSFDRHVSNFVHRALFGQHPLAHEILGEKDTIAGLPRDTMVAYHAARYHPKNMVLIASGAAQPDEFFAAAERYCREWNGSWTGGPAAAPPSIAHAGVFQQPLKQFKQQSVVIAYPAPAYGGEWDEVLSAFSSLFGGSNSRCYWNIVQKGVCASAGVVWLAYADCGVLAFYADGEAEQCEAMYAALRTEMAQILTKPFSLEDVTRVRNQRRTQLALEGENPRTRFMQIVDDIEERGHPQTMAARMAAVEAVTPERISAYFTHWPLGGDGAILVSGPRAWAPGPATHF